MTAIRSRFNSIILSMLTIGFTLALPVMALAQESSGSSALFLGGAIWVICGATFFIINIAILVWVYRDARKRGADAILWAALTFFFGLIGLLLYFAIGRKNTAV